jgi:molybdenum cofactor sulfurtransferase
MVDVDPSSGMKGKTLRALADYRRRNNGQITFGIFLRGVGDEKSGQPGVWLEEGDTMFCK